MAENISLEVKPILHEIGRGMELKKCRKCGCMQTALEAATRAFGGSEEPYIQTLVSSIEEYKARMEPIAYDCIGCKKCWGADATKELGKRFENIEPESCGSGCTPIPANLPIVRRVDVEKAPWPPYPGDYVVGSPGGSVAVCTLSSRDLAVSLIALGYPSIAIAGRCDTENIGVEKVVLNLLANPGTRWLILCGYEAKGHRAGDAFLHLKEQGVDANMRVLESASWRPVLKNLTLVDVARFREQIEVVNLVGVTDPAQIAAAAREVASRPLLPLSAFEDISLSFEHIKAKAPERLKLDPAGFFIVLPQPETRLILCEHYENNGRLAHVIEGWQASLIASTVVEKGLITRLDHAVYLGRELAKAELSLRTGALYEQDAALGNLPPAELAAMIDTPCKSTKTCACR
jgi:tetrahydromethanopterin S-methyltransferase subunit A